MALMPPDPGEPGSAVEQLVRVFDSLHFPGAVKWAKDGRLALLTSSRVDVYEYPGEEQEPYYRWYIPLHKERHFHECGTLVAQRAYEQRDSLAWMIHRITGTESAPPMFVAMDWSPTGCAWDGGCLLATLSSDGLLELWAPPLATRGAQWAPVARITPLLEAYLLRTEYSPEGVSPELARAAVGTDGLAGMGGGAGEKAEGGGSGGNGGNGGVKDEESEAEGARRQRRRACTVWLDQDGEEPGTAATTDDAVAWATRQDMASITALAWAGERVGVGEGRRAALLAAGGPKLVHVWALLPGGAAPVASSDASAGEEGEAGGQDWAEQVLNPRPKASAFPEEGTAPARAPATHCLTPRPAAPVALWESKAGEVARLAWFVDGGSVGSSGGGGASSEEGCSLLLAVASTYGNIDLVRVTHTPGGGGPGRWAATPLLALSGADYGVVQGLSFGTVHVALPPAPAGTAEEGEGGAEQAAAPAAVAAVSLLVTAKGNAVHAWTIPEGRPLAAPLEAHEEPVMSVDWARAPDGSEPVLLSAGGDGLVQAWRFEVVPSVAEDGGEAVTGAAAVPGLALVTEPALSALVPTRREALLGLAVSPNGLLLAVARVAEGDEGNSRQLQFNRKLRRNHAWLGVQPLFQTGWRSVVLPEEPWGLLAAMGWAHRLLPPPPPTAQRQGNEPAAPEQDGDTVASLLDIPMAAGLDFNALMAMQLHPDILAPQGTALMLPGGASGNDNGGDGGEGMEEDGGDEGMDVSIKPDTLTVASDKPRPKKGPGSRGGPFELRTPVDISALPEGSHDLLPYTVYHRLGALLLGITSAAAAGGGDNEGAMDQEPQPQQQPVAAPVCVWQALHALHAHAAARLLTPSPHMMEVARRLQGAARVHLTARYVDRSLARLLRLHRGGDGEQLPAEERRMVWAMARWLRARRAMLEREAPAGPPVWGAGGDGTWEGLAAAGRRRCGLAADGANEAALAAELEERCFLCESALGDDALDDDADGTTMATCQNPEAPHRLLRCMETLRVVASAEYWECPLCAAAARPHLPPAPAEAAVGGNGDEGASWPFETRPAWLAPFYGGGGVWCLFCHVPCRLVNA